MSYCLYLPLKKIFPGKKPVYNEYIRSVQWKIQKNSFFIIPLYCGALHHNTHPHCIASMFFWVKMIQNGTRHHFKRVTCLQDADFFNRTEYSKNFGWSVAVFTVTAHFIYSHFWFLFQIGCFLHWVQSVSPTLDIAINFWLTDFYLRAMKWNAWEIHLKNFMADILISLGSIRGQWKIWWLIRSLTSSMQWYNWL